MFFFFFLILFCSKKLTLRCNCVGSTLCFWSGDCWPKDCFCFFIPLLWQGKSNEVSSVQFSPLTDWVVEGTWGNIHKRSSSRLFLQEALVDSSGMGRDVRSLMLSIHISSADHSVAQTLRCPEGWFWRGCYGVWHARTMQVSVSSSPRFTDRCETADDAASTYHWSCLKHDVRLIQSLVSKMSISSAKYYIILN